VWSPTNAEASILAVIRGARHSLAVQNEEMDDSTLISALAATARRGVDVTITEWDRAFSELARDGVHIRLYAHATPYSP
jgi:cardiolipin synthase A/B